MRTTAFSKTGRVEGFTLIEIMVVVVIIGLLAALIVPNIMGNLSDARISAAQDELRTISGALDTYKLRHYKYPTTELGIAALVNDPGDPDVKNWRQYLPHVPLDPWDREYLYESPPTTEHRDREYDLYTFGSDGVEGGEGEAADISVWDLR